VPNILFTVALLIEGFEKKLEDTVAILQISIIDTNPKIIATRNEVKKASQNKVQEQRRSRMIRSAPNLILWVLKRGSCP
jgi:hypothetical protein